MTEHEKVLKGLECHRNGFCFACPYDDDDTLDTTNCKRQLVEDAIALLKEQEAKPVLSDRKCETLPNHYERKGFCPKCHQFVEWYLNRSYCGFCGQAVKWDG